MNTSEDIKLLLKTSVSLFQRKTDSVSTLVQIGDVVEAIRGDCFKKTILEVRLLASEGRKDEARMKKGSLPAVTFCATFGKERKADTQQSYNNLMVIDIDHLDDDIELHRVGNCLMKDPFVACYWSSPSGNGWKGLIPIIYINEIEIGLKEKHLQAFITVKDYLKENYNIDLDASGSDLSRLCFLSWDPELVIKDEYQRMPIVLRNIEKNTRQVNEKRGEVKSKTVAMPINLDWKYLEGTSNMRKNQVDRKTIENIYKYLSTRRLSITSTYDDWTKVAFAIANTFHPVYGRRIFMKLCELDGINHDVLRSERLLFDAYCAPNKQIQFASIIYLAREKGYI